MVPLMYIVQLTQTSSKQDASRAGGATWRPAAVWVGFLFEMVRREMAEPSRFVVEYELIVRAARDPVLAREVAAYERNLGARLAEGLERLGVAQSLDAARTLIALVRRFEIDCLTHSAPPL